MVIEKRENKAKKTILYVCLIAGWVLFHAEMGHACCFRIPEKVDTLAAGIVQITRYGPDTVYSIDTVTETGMLRHMDFLYHASRYCIIGTIDSVFEFFLPPDSEGIRYNADSIRIKVDTCLKGKLTKKYVWSIDTRMNCTKSISDSIDETLGICIVPGPGDYRTLIGQDVFLFADSWSRIRKCHIQPPGGCVDVIQGYVIDDEQVIHNKAEFPYVDITYDTFLQSIGTATQRSLPDYADRGLISKGDMHTYGRNIHVDCSDMQAPVQVCIYTMTGRMVAAKYRLHPGRAVLSFRIPGTGVYVVRIRTDNIHISKQITIL